MICFQYKVERINHYFNNLTTLSIYSFFHFNFINLTITIKLLYISLKQYISFLVGMFIRKINFTKSIQNFKIVYPDRIISHINTMKNKNELIIL